MARLYEFNHPFRYRSRRIRVSLPFEIPSIRAVALFPCHLLTEWRQTTGSILTGGELTNSNSDQHAPPLRILKSDGFATVRNDFLVALLGVKHKKTGA